MKKWVKSAYAFIIILLISVSVVFIMSMVKEWFLKISLAEEKSIVNNDYDKKPVTLRFAWWGGQTRHIATTKAIEVFSRVYRKSLQLCKVRWTGHIKHLRVKFAGR